MTADGGVHDDDRVHPSRRRACARGGGESGCGTVERMVLESALLAEAREGETSRLRVCPSFRPVKALNAKISIPPLVICMGCKQDSAEELQLRGTVNCV